MLKHFLENAMEMLGSDCGKAQTDRDIAEVISRQSPSEADMAKRFTVNLPDLVAAKLQAFAESTDQPFASVAAIAIERAVDLAIKDGEIPPALLEKNLKEVMKTQ